MSEGRWEEIESLLQRAVERGRGVLADADPELRREVESLLAMRGNPVPSAAPNPTIAAGTIVGSYRLESQLGQGGMGVVYRAVDTRLNRPVAIKFLASDLADPDARRRFQREAHAASSLNHPHILTVHDVGEFQGRQFIVTEFVDGGTLTGWAERQKPDWRQVVELLAGVADGLAVAHDAGILHRDIKPANVLVSKNGYAKLADFGLAKLVPTANSEPAGSESVTSPLFVIGTVPYMSPEQALGQILDSRSDIFSFGVMLYEMLAGARPFAGATSMETLRKVIHEPAPPLPENIPATVRMLVEKALEKDPSVRYQSMRELAIDLRRVLIQSGQTSVVTTGAVARQKTPLSRLAMYAAGAILAVGAIVWTTAMLAGRGSEPELRTVRFAFTPSQLLRGAPGQIDAGVSVSPDGKHIAYIEAQGRQLWVRDIDREDAGPIPGAVRVQAHFWAPDSQNIGFASGRQIWKIPIQGGTPTPIANLQGGFRGASWSSDGKTLVFAQAPDGLYTISAEGGTPKRIREHGHIENPSILDLPDGRQAYLYQMGDTGVEAHSLWVQVEGEPEGRVIATSTSGNPHPAYSPTGHIVYVDGSSESARIWALPFSLSTLEATGKPFLVAERGSNPRISQSGTLVYSDTPSNRVQLRFLDRSGKALETIGEPGWLFSPVLSPDGRKLAIEAAEDAAIWIFDVERGVKTQLTFERGRDQPRGWTADGRELMFASNRAGNFDVYLQRVGANAQAVPLLQTPLTEWVPDMTPDQTYLVYEVVDRELKHEVFYRKREADGRLSEPVRFLEGRLDIRDPRLSPDGQYVAYTSGRSGRFEVYVSDFPAGANEWQISSDGGGAQRWRPDGKELLYVQAGNMMAVSIDRRSGFRPGTPEVLFQRPLLQAGYDVSSDGKRFVVLEQPDGGRPLAIHIVHNWFEEFRRKQ